LKKPNFPKRIGRFSGPVRFVFALQGIAGQACGTPDDVAALLTIRID